MEKQRAFTERRLEKGIKKRLEIVVIDYKLAGLIIGLLTVSAGAFFGVI